MYQLALWSLIRGKLTYLNSDGLNVVCSICTFCEVSKIELKENEIL